MIIEVVVAAANRVAKKIRIGLRTESKRVRRDATYPENPKKLHEEATDVSKRQDSTKAC